MTDPSTPRTDAQPADERPNSFPDDDRPTATEVPALDEAPDGASPADTTDSSSDSLPPGSD
jgi:hypothetical protein